MKRRKTLFCVTIRQSPRKNAMRQAIKIFVLLLVCGAAVGYYAYSRGAVATPGKAESQGTNPGQTGAGGKAGGPPVAIPVAIAHVRQRPIPIYLDGLGTVQAFQIVTARSQVDGKIDSVDFVEGQNVHKGDKLAQIDDRTYRAQLNQALAKKLQDQAKELQDRARVLQDQAKKAQDEALEKQAQSRKVQDQALENQVQAKKAQDSTNLANARVNLKRFEDSLKENAVSDQVVTDQRSLVSQLESTIRADEAAIQAAAAAVQGDEVAIQAVHATVQGDDAAIQADNAAVKGDEAAVQSDEAAIQFAQTFVSYCTITAPIDGRTGVRQVDAGNIVHANDAISNSTGSMINGIVVITQLQPISVVFTLPQQNLQAINTRRAVAKLKVIAMDSDGKTELDHGELLLVDNQIDQTTGTIKLKATFPNEKFKLWPGGFVNMRLLLETREDALAVSSPAVQQGPNGAYVYLIKPDQTVELRLVKVSLIQDGKAILVSGLAKDDEVVLTGHDRLKNGSKISVDRTKNDKKKDDKPKTEVSEKDTPVDEANNAPKAHETSASGATK